MTTKPHGELHVEEMPDGVEFQEWMDQHPHDPAVFADRPSRTDEEVAFGRRWMQMLKQTAADEDAGLLKRDDFINERNIASAAHQLGNFDLIAMSTDELLKLADTVRDRSRVDLYLKLVLALEAREKYPHRSF